MNTANALLLILAVTALGIVVRGRQEGMSWKGAAEVAFEGVQGVGLIIVIVMAAVMLLGG